MIRLLPAAAIVAALAACGPTTRKVTMKVAPAMPPPTLYDPWNVKAALICPQALRQFRSTGTERAYAMAELQEIVEYDLDFGDFHCRLFDALARAAFSEVHASEDGATPPVGTMIVLRPAVEKAAYGGGADIRYALTLQRPDGTEIAVVRGGAIAPGYKPEERWIDLAVRDAIAELLLKLERDSAFREWVAEQGRAGAAS